MTTTIEECERKAKSLPLPQRALLIEHLISSLDELDEKECERLWIAEAKRRYAQYTAGNIPARPAAEVFRDAKATLSTIR